MRHWKIIGAVVALAGAGALQMSGFTSLPLAIFLGVVCVGLIVWSAWPSLQRIRLQSPIKLGKEPKPEASPVTEIPSWLEQELSSDLKRVYEGVRGRITSWDFSNIYNREPYFEIFVELINTTIFKFCLKSISGFMKIANEKCVNSPNTSTRFNITREKPEIIRLTQSISPETVKLIQESGNNNKELNFDLGEVIFEIENTTEGYEKYKPYMTGGKHNIVPKDGLKIEDKIEIDVCKHLVRQIGEPGYFPIDVEFTLTASRLPIQLAKAQLCIADEIVEPVTISPTIPRILEANVESYIVKYEPTYKQFLKSRITSSDRERELNLRLSRARWTNEECKAHLRLTIKGKEEDFPEFTFDFGSSRSQ